MKGNLLDLNLLLALAWPNHQFHLRATEWFSAERRGPWSTCAITEVGFVRLSSHPAFTAHAVTPGEAVLLLARMTEDAEHVYAGESPRFVDRVFDAIVPRIAGHRQVTDSHLVGLAVRHDLRLVTFDRRVRALSPEPERVEVLAL